MEKEKGDEEHTSSSPFSFSSFLVRFQFSALADAVATVLTAAAPQIVVAIFVVHLVGIFEV
jgi:hypothetical protein